MLLSDADIRMEMRERPVVSPRQPLVVTNLQEGAIGPCSVDLMLSNYFHHFEDNSEAEIDPKFDQSRDGWEHTVLDGSHFVLGPKEFCLASTKERWTFPPHLAGQLEGKSSLGRLGLVVHVTAGFFDAGFDGYPTLELCNLRGRPMRLYPGMPIAQMAVFRLSSPVQVSYAGKKGKYAGQGERPAPSQYHRNFLQG